MAKSKLVTANRNLAKKVTSAFHKIEDTVVGS